MAERIIFLLFFLAGCQSSADKILKEVDTLMVQQPDRAILYEDTTG